jgi:Spy/CpxP family protein refolding chaperone
MDYFSAIKYYKWIIGFLILLNLATISLFWVINFKEHRLRNDQFGPLHQQQHAHKRDKSIEFLVKELNLTQNQSLAFKDEREKHFLQIDPLKNSIHSKKEQLFNDVFRKQVDSIETFKLQKEINLLENELEELKLKHFLKLSSICTDVQKEKLKGIFHHLILREKEIPSRIRNRQSTNH